jgi:hypothetical protein
VANNRSDDKRIVRLAKEAKRLDDLIQQAAAMQKKIVDQIQHIGEADTVNNKNLPQKRRKMRRIAR